ncbi:MAG: phosphoribosylglycinamide formyltransferase [Deltaproteobacteria bacterium]|nr:phosphoribosylglycinamide formyltransferase [Deltaproteobacteria bacterium]
MKTPVAVLISGSGSNLQAIIDQTEAGTLPINICCVISNKADAFGLERARKHGIAAVCITSKGKAREEHEREIVDELDARGVELVVLAGYMRLLGHDLLERYKGRVINIHPALLPSFPGSHGYEDAWNYGVKVSGCTVHFVDEGCDTGPIILQGVNPVEPDDTFESFRQRGLSIEHKVLPEAIRLYCAGRLRIEGRRVMIAPDPAESAGEV